MPRRKRSVDRPFGRVPGAWTALLSSVAAALTLGGCGGADHGADEPLEVVSVLGEPGRFPGQFAYPRGMDHHGPALIVVDKSARIQRFDSTTGAFLGGWRMPEYELGKPTGLTVGPHPLDGSREALWVADTHYHRVMVYELPDDPLAVTSSNVLEGEEIPEPVARFGTYGLEAGHFVYPTDIAILPSNDPDRPVERVYVSEYGGADRVSIWEASADDPGTFVFVSAFGVPGSGDGVEFHRPQSLLIDVNRDELDIVDSGNHRVGRFTLDGELIAWIGSPDAQAIDGEPPPPHYPYSLAMLDDGTTLLAEYGGCRVRRMNLATGETLETFGVAGRNEGELYNPWGVTVIGRTAYVLDSGNNRVLAFRSPRPAASSIAAGGGDR